VTGSTIRNGSTRTNNSFRPRSRRLASTGASPAPCACACWNGLEIKVRDAPIYQGSSRVGITVLRVGQRVRVTGVWEHDYIIATRVDIL
jgi:hypothetical protein